MCNVMTWGTAYMPIDIIDLGPLNTDEHCFLSHSKLKIPTVALLSSIIILQLQASDFTNKSSKFKKKEKN